MAKTQRWRRGGPAGEDNTSAADAPTDATETPADEATADEVGEAPEETAAEPADEALFEESDEALFEADPPTDEPAGEAEPATWDEADDAELEADLDPDQDTGIDEVDAAEHAAEDADEEIEVDDAVEVDFDEPATDFSDPDTELDDTELNDAELNEDEDDAADDTESDDDDDDDEDEDDEPAPARDHFGATGTSPFGPRGPGSLVPVQLLQAAHAKQAIGTALAMGLAAAIAGRPAREAAIVLLTVLVGQTILGWHNDIVDRERDQTHGVKGKPIGEGRLSTETAWYAIVVATLILVPLAITTGIKAGCIYMGAVAVGMLGNVVLRSGFFSWWSWAASFALLPAYLSYGGWGGQAVGSAPETVIVILAALLGVGIHFMRAVWGLVADHEEGWTYLPLKLGLKLGATRLLAVTTLYTAVIVILLLVMGAKVGLSR